MKKILAMVLALCLMFCVSAASAEGMVDKIKEKGALVLGTEATYGPYEFLDDDANPIGCDIWLAQQIADELGVELQVTDMAFDGIIDAVKTGMVDIGIAAFTVNEERAKVIDFSHEYEKSQQLLIVKKGDADTYTTVESLAGQKVGAQMGTIQSQLVETSLPDSELFELDTYPSLALELVNGNIAGFVCDYAVGMGMVASNDKLEVANFTFTSEEASFGKACVVAQGNEDFLEVVNKVIDKVVEDGSYLEKFNEYNAIWNGEVAD